jgi:hypothetical protein
LLLQNVVNYLAIVFVAVIFRSVFDNTLDDQSPRFVQVLGLDQAGQVALFNVLQQLTDREVEKRRGELVHPSKIQRNSLAVFQRLVDLIVNLPPVFLDDTSRTDLILDE